MEKFPQGAFIRICKAQYYLLRNYSITVQGDVANKE